MAITEKDPAAYCEWIYGPVKSRRHGISLGINLGEVTNKICTWGCVYCQCGFGERRDFISKDIRATRQEILEKLKLKIPSLEKIDSITFAGNTEPGSHPDILKIVQDVMKLKKDLNASFIVNCLSNASELNREDVVQAFNLLDEAWVKLDCGVEDQYRRLNRPLERLGSVRDQVDRIKKIKNLKIQTLVWDADDKRVSNWNEENKKSLIEIYKELKPIEVHLTTLARVPAMPQLKSVQNTDLQNFANVILKLGIGIKVFS